VGSPEEFERFRRVVLGDPELQARLRSFAEWPAFVDAAVAAAAEHGIAITLETVQEARNEARRSWLERWV
jgi:glutaredoxin-related protein